MKKKRRRERGKEEEEGGGGELKTMVISFLFVLGTNGRMQPVTTVAKKRVFWLLN